MRTYLVFLITTLLSVGQAFGWTAAAHSPSTGYLFVGDDASDPDEATQQALDGCSKKANDCKILTPAFSGPAALIFARGDGHIFYVRDKDPNVAARNVLEDCKKAASGCKANFAVWEPGRRWVALAKGEDSVHLIYKADSKRGAIKEAIEACEASATTKGACREYAPFTTGKHVWLSYASNDTRTRVGYGLSEASSADADKSALQSCQITPSVRCVVKERYENPGPVNAPASFVELEKKIAASKKLAKAPTSTPKQDSGDCRPRTQTLRCSSQCTNGNCIVTYENGCKIPVRVNPKFNPFNNNWEYPSPSC